VASYIDIMIEMPDLPIFVLSEIRNDTALFNTKIPIIHLLEHSSFVLQLKERRPDVQPFHFVLSIMGMTIFPFIASPVFGNIPMIQATGFNNMMQERKKFIPQWVKAMLEV
jgi:hypothetical protein